MGDKPEVTVIQADRERAWPHRYQGAYGEDSKEAWMSGRYDKSDIIQAFARHRASQSESDAVREFQIGDRVTKTRGSSWTGRVVGTYSTELTPEGYAVESENEPGSVQIYPAAALTRYRGEV